MKKIIIVYCLSVLIMCMFVGCSNSSSSFSSYEEDTQTSSSSDKEICTSCGKSVDELITKEVAPGDSRSWCWNCWADYKQIRGK